MRTYAEHQRAVRELLEPLERAASQRIELLRLTPVENSDPALGRVLADDVFAPIDLPGFANSQMDGYAVRAAELTGAQPDQPVTLAVGPTSAAGDPVRELQVGTASPIMTGAAVPRGADAVVPIEAAVPPRFIGLGGEAHDSPADARVSFTQPVEVGAFVRTIGSDVARGTLLLAIGTRLGPAQLGSLAAAGVTEVTVRRRLTVLLLSTGHELRPPGAALASGQIYDANTAMLSAALRESGAVVREALAPDDTAAVLAAVEASASLVDLVITTGGVSAGAFEVVRDALSPLGVEFVKVAMQPGGPQGLGMVGEVPVVAFPGNPVSALVSFELFLRPVLRALGGLQTERRQEQRPLAHDVTSPLARHQVRRGSIDERGAVQLGGPSSHLLHDYARATVLVHLPVGVDAMPAGAIVNVWRIDD